MFPADPRMGYNVFNIGKIDIMQKHLMSMLLFLNAVFCYSLQTASTIEPPRIADVNFHPSIEDPAYPAGEGPVVLIDEAHNNFHTAVGTYYPFVRILERDGYVVKRGKEPLTAKGLMSCQVLVIADAQPPFHEKDPPTFSQKEIVALHTWVREGGALFLITDHRPDPAAIANLASVFGIEINNGYVMNRNVLGRERPIVFGRGRDRLSDHLITRGRVGFGMNHPQAEDNAQFLLNVMHWLSGLL